MHTIPLLFDLVKYPILLIQVHKHFLKNADEWIISQQFSKCIIIKYWKIKKYFYISWSLLNYIQEKIKIKSLTNFRYDKINISKWRNQDCVDYINR